jgi:anthranilate synthase component 2
MKILLFDNYDSFTYNLLHLVNSITDAKVEVYRNDAITLEKIKEYDKIILSPGPGIPEEAGLLLAVIKTYASTKSILGVCLGHQAIAEAFGGTLINLENVYHGIATNCTVLKKDAKMLQGLAENFTIGRYHSWVADEKTLPKELLITAKDDNGQIMALQHKTLDVHGVQFHPESILTPEGKRIMENFILQ